MKIRIFYLLVLFGLLIYFSCKTADEAIQYTLTVTVGEGIIGVPETGTFTYNENDTVTYFYSTDTGFGNLIVTLDNVNIETSGTITMNGNHNLNIKSDIDVRGKWIGNFYSPSKKYMDATFSGDIFSGTVQAGIESVNGKGYGNFSVTGDQIDFTLQFSSVTLDFSGTIEGVNRISGTWQISNSAGNCTLLPRKLPENGTWELER